MAYHVHCALEQCGLSAFYSLELHEGKARFQGHLALGQQWFILLEPIINIPFLKDVNCRTAERLSLTPVYGLQAWLSLTWCSRLKILVLTLFFVLLHFIPNWVSFPLGIADTKALIFPSAYTSQRNSCFLRFCSHYAFCHGDCTIWDCPRIFWTLYETINRVAAGAPEAYSWVVEKMSGFNKRLPSSQTFTLIGW